MNPATQITSFISILKELIANEPKDKQGLRAWREKAEKAKKALTQVDSEMPHFLWHYLEDVDIRLKDPRYSLMQNRQAQEFVDEVESRNQTKELD